MTTAVAVSAGPTEARVAPLLALEGLSRRFGNRVALHGLSLEVREREVLGLLGPNGAGKSTAFALLAGLLRPDGGRVGWRGTWRATTDAAFRAELGLVFQRSTLDDTLTARENLRLAGRLYGLSRSETGARSAEMLALIHLADRADERVDGWSGGMRRRLELVRALLHRPRLLLMDEPTQGLDEAAFRAFWAHLRMLREREGLTVLLTTHRSDEAAECDRLAVLDEGRLVALDTRDALSARVGGDVLLLEGPDPAALAQEIRARLGLSAEVVDGKVRLEQPQGHTVIPRVVEALPAGRLRAVHLRKPTLADVFLGLTGKRLAEDA